MLYTLNCELIGISFIFVVSFPLPMCHLHIEYKVGLASSLYHREELDRRNRHDALICATLLYISTQVQELSQYAKVAKRGEDVYAERVTGTHPHVIHTCLLEELMAKVDCLVPSFCSKMEEQLDARIFNGTISEAQMRSLIEESQRGVQEQIQLLQQERIIPADLMDGTGRAGSNQQRFQLARSIY
jgi:hypothetical protein